MLTFLSFFLNSESDDVFSYAKQGKSSEISGILESVEANVNAKDDQVTSNDDLFIFDFYFYFFYFFFYSNDSKIL